MDSILQGQVALVLGASAEGGSGWTIARMLAEQGAKVVVAARRFEGVRQLAELTGGFAVQCDAADDASVADMVAAALEHYGRIDIAIMAAGVPVVGDISSLPIEDFHRATAANYFGFYHLLRNVAPVMTDGGSILVLTSLSATHVSPGYAAHGSAKAASQAMVRYAAIEFAPRGIRVNALCPGLIETPMAQGLLKNDAIRRAMYKEIPLGRGVLPVQIAASALDLVRPGSAITGQTIIVDNGLNLRRSPYPDEVPQEAFEQGARAAGY